MKLPIPTASNRPLIVMINTATVSRLPSMCDRIARGLKKYGLSVKVVDTLGLTDCKNFEFAYKQGQFKCQVVILQGSFYVACSAKSRANGSLFYAKSVRPQLSFLLDYEEELHEAWKKRGDLHPAAFIALPKQVFGTVYHYRMFIEKDSDELYACGRIVDVVLSCF